MFNNTSEIDVFQGFISNQTYEVLKLPLHMIVVFSCAFGLIFLCAVVGNVMVVLVVVRSPPMHTVTNYFIVNLAVADILVAVFCIPITLLDNIYSGWPFGNVLCKMMPYIQGVSVCVTVYNLAAIAFDRCLAIVFGPRWRIMKRGAYVILVLIWVFSLLLMLPWLLYYREWELSSNLQTISLCYPFFPEPESEPLFFIIAIFLGTYLLPLSVIFVCYLFVTIHVWKRRAPGVSVGSRIIRRSKMKIVKMLITVVLVFALSWLPLHVVYFINYFGPSYNNETYDNISNIAIPLAQWLELSNSGMNVFIYSFFSCNFRRGFLHLWFCIRRKKKPLWNADSLTRTRTRTSRSRGASFHQLATTSVGLRSSVGDIPGNSLQHNVSSHQDNEQVSTGNNRLCLRNVSKVALNHSKYWDLPEDCDLNGGSTPEQYSANATNTTNTTCRMLRCGRDLAVVCLVRRRMWTKRQTFVRRIRRTMFKCGPAITDEGKLIIATYFIAYSIATKRHNSLSYSCCSR